MPESWWHQSLSLLCSRDGWWLCPTTPCDTKWKEVQKDDRGRVLTERKLFSWCPGKLARLTPSTNKEEKGQELQRYPSPRYLHGSLEPWHILSDVCTMILTLLLWETKMGPADTSNCYNCALFRTFWGSENWKLCMFTLKKSRNMINMWNCRQRSEN